MDKPFFQRIGYPQAWLEDAQRYTATDAYVAFDPAWEDPLPEIPNISIDDLLRRTARAHPDRIALSFLDKDISYAEFDRLIGRFSAVLQGLGLKKGDFIVPMLPPCPQHWISFFATARIGAISAPLNVMFKDKEIAYQVSDCGARTIVTLDVFYPYFEKLRKTLPIDNIIVTHIQDYADPEFAVYPALEPLWNSPRQKFAGTLDFLEVMERHPPVEPTVSIDPKQDAPLVIYTSGTTGEPKGAIATHFNLVHNTVTGAHLCRHAEKPVNYSILPMNHVGGYMVYQLPMFFLGGTVVPRPVFDIEDCYKAIQKHRVTTVFGPPTFYQGLMMHPRQQSYDVSSLVLCTAGAAPVPKSVRQAWHAKTGCTLIDGWGGTEMNAPGTLSVLKNKAKADSVGLPYVGEVKIEQDGRLARRGETGEILYRGMQVCKGYLNKPKQTAESFQRDGWFRTGDAGYIDEDGFLHFVDRIKDLIIASGYNIAPVEVEAALLTHPAVLEAGVIGVPDEYRGETVKAFVVLKPEARGTVSEKEIIEFCKGIMAAFKVPTRIEFIDALPRNALGKTLRRMLKSREAGHGG
jgi:long-chain acyl-CoA synthetase